MKIKRDSLQQPYIEWSTDEEYNVRVWIKREKGSSFWRHIRHLCIARCKAMGQPGANTVSIPIYSQVSDEQILAAFVGMTSVLTGAERSESGEWRKPTSDDGIARS